MMPYSVLKKQPKTGARVQKSTEFAYLNNSNIESRGTNRRENVTVSENIIDNDYISMETIS